MLLKNGFYLASNDESAGLGDGSYEFGGFTVKVADGIARKEDGTLASGTLTLFQAVKNMTKFTDVTFGEAVKMASMNPAEIIGADRWIGSIESGKRADLLILDENMEIEEVICRGKRI
jgi:N-acetylglucosamine-6-phosphate deacetylase